MGISDSAWAMHLLGLQDAVPGSSYRSLTQSLPMLRAVKDANELARLAAAGAAADATYEQILGVRFAGRKETDVAADLARLLKEFGTSRSTSPWSARARTAPPSPRGGRTHHRGRRCGRPRLRWADARLRLGHQPHGVLGEPSAEVREVHEIVRAAQQAGVEAVGPGVACQEIDRAARAVITDAGYGEQFIHRTGHGIGTTTHEPPYMIEGEEQPLVPGCASPSSPDLPRRPVRGPHRGHRHGHRDRGRRLNNTERDLRMVQ